MFTIRTDMKKYVLALENANPNMGVASLGEDEPFDLMKGVKVALLRLLVSPSGHWPVDYDGGSDYTIVAETDRVKLTSECMSIAKWIGVCTSRTCPVGLWSVLEHSSKNLRVELTITG